MKWTNIKLKEKGKDALSKLRFDAYIGIERAMSLNPTSRIADYWSTKNFIGNTDIQKIMSITEFSNICANICHYLLHDREVAKNDPYGILVQC